MKQAWITREEYEKDQRTLSRRLDSRGPMTPPAFSAYLTTANQSITSTGADVKIQLNAELFDNYWAFDSVTNYRWTCPVTGKYQINAAVRITNASNNPATIYVRLKLNNTTYILMALYEIAMANGLTYQRPASRLYNFAASDYVEMFIVTDQQPITVIQAGSIATFFDAHFIGT